MEAEILDDDETETLPRISVPALVISGSKNSATKPFATELMRQSIPHAGLIVLSPAKHLGLIEHHLEYAETVSRFEKRSIGESSL